MTTLEIQLRGKTFRDQFPLTTSCFDHVHCVNEATAIIRQALEHGKPDRYGWVQWSANGQDFAVREASQHTCETCGSDCDEASVICDGCSEGND